MKVYVYFNLHKKCFSVKALEGEQRGRVIAHCDQLTLKNVIFRVSQIGRKRVIYERQKNVHAGVVGEWSGTCDPVIADESDIPVTYNPYKYSSFVYEDSELPIYAADRALLANKRVYV